jgi:hypothetical protein
VGVGIAAQRKAVDGARRHKAMQKKPVFPNCEHDLARPETFWRAAFNFYDITGKKRGEHAFAVHAHANGSIRPRLAPQNVGYQGCTRRGPIRSLCNHGPLKHQDVL